MKRHIGGEPPGNEKAPQVGTLGGSSKDSVAATATSNGVSIQLAADKLPDVWASALAPGPGRRLWVVSYVCAHCGFPHLGRARTFERLLGVRRARCGRRVWVNVARVYVGRRR
jgi:DNA-directed RNA polymerase subunit RPC12/RpoP